MEEGQKKQKSARKNCETCRREILEALEKVDQISLLTPENVRLIAAEVMRQLRPYLPVQEKYDWATIMQTKDKTRRERMLQAWWMEEHKG